MLPDVISRLEAEYGRPEPVSADVFELIVRENIAYLADDRTRDSAIERLRQEVGLSAESILAADSAVLRSIAASGILADNTVSKLRRIAEMTLQDWGGDLLPILDLPREKAIRALKKFPSIGDPGAEKILLFTGREPILALDSNGLRVLIRLGYGQDTGNYRAAYRSSQAAASKEIPGDSAALTRAHLLLRRHGKETCKATRPRCEICVIRHVCPFAVTPS